MLTNHHISITAEGENVEGEPLIFYVFGVY